MPRGCRQKGVEVYLFLVMPIWSQQHGASPPVTRHSRRMVLSPAEGIRLIGRKKHVTVFRRKCNICPPLLRLSLSAGGVYALVGGSCWRWCCLPILIWSLCKADASEWWRFGYRESRDFGLRLFVARQHLYMPIYCCNSYKRHGLMVPWLRSIDPISKKKKKGKKSSSHTDTKYELLFA